MRVCFANSVLFVCLAVGCVPNTPTQSTAKVALPQDQITRLFSTTWDANDKATLAYAANQSSDLEALKNYSWLHCIQLKANVFFKNEGLMWITSRDQSLVDLPVDSEMFNQKIRMIDNFHFAFNDGAYWLVFRARDWEDANYQPPN